MSPAGGLCGECALKVVKLLTKIFDKMSQLVIKFPGDGGVEDCKMLESRTLFLITYPMDTGAVSQKSVIKDSLGNLEQGIVGDILAIC